MITLPVLLAALLLVGDEPDVKAEMIPTTGLITPGGTTLLAVHLELEPGWHVYWENPGDSGIATTLQVKGPKGFVVGPVLYPVPKRIDQPGGLVCYGYEDTACLFVEVTAPKTLKGNEFLFTAEVQWLVCDDVCFSGEAKLSAKLRRRRGVGLPAPDKRLTPHLKRLPQPLSTWPSATARFSGSITKPVMIVTLPPRTTPHPETKNEEVLNATFFAAAFPGLEITQIEVKDRGAKTELRVSCTFTPLENHPAPTLRGVLLVTTQDKEQIPFSLEPKWPTQVEDS